MLLQICCYLYIIYIVIEYFSYMTDCTASGYIQQILMPRNSLLKFSLEIQFGVLNGRHMAKGWTPIDKSFLCKVCLKLFTIIMIFLQIDTYIGYSTSNRRPSSQILFEFFY